MLCFEDEYEKLQNRTCEDSKKQLKTTVIIKVSGNIALHLP